jgi:hypothetical protein
LTCGLEETVGHVHTDECYEWAEGLTVLWRRWTAMCTRRVLRMGRGPDLWLEESEGLTQRELL